MRMNGRRSCDESELGLVADGGSWISSMVVCRCRQKGKCGSAWFGGV